VTAFVLDASIALAWCFADEATPATGSTGSPTRKLQHLRSGNWEVANALAMAEPRGRLSIAGLTRSVGLLQRLAIAIDPAGPDRAFRELMDLARSERLTVYDAAYLELALRLGLPLASKDSKLRKTAEGLGLTVLGT
jgi:predicted nucleic acid-binding protein